MSLMMSDHRLPREVRLRRQIDFNRVHQTNAFAADDTLVIKAAANGLDYVRIGISLSRHVGNSVLRNRWKRLIREAFRVTRSNLPTGLDLVVRPKRGSVADFELIQKSLLQLTPRLARRLTKERP